MKRSLILLAVLILAGCGETQKQPSEWTERDRVQNDMLVKHNAVIHGLDQEKDGKKVHQNGLIDYMNILDARLKALEAVDPNALEPRIKALEKDRERARTTTPPPIKGTYRAPIESEDEFAITKALSNKELKKKLVSLAEYNNEALDFAYASTESRPNGIACPDCGAELLDTAPHIIPTSNPPRFRVGCSKCDYTGTRF